ncbi:PP2C family protein-serine/threonine phosphatase [Streptomyces fuscigenes]|uniref:PP2C family protein-serine/threonine phosphatase n=1 Tax=Streptomyces fuscigenes TaxID=1528880 RepID=UPI001F33ED8E|nr:mucin-2 [Streptomyces fuscigenes]MCF3960292.1 mucin-2 [Streptomyces fuscigenes]
MSMRNWSTARHVGGRPRQCDATAVRVTPNGTRAYALLDGVGTSREVARWTAGAAHRVAALAARHQDAEAGLRAAYDHYTGRPYPADPFQDLPYAAAVVAVTAPGRPLTVAWCGDARAYLWAGGTCRQLTADHNRRRVYPPYGRANHLTSALGSNETDAEVRATHGHAAVESVTRHLDRFGRLLLASDGAYDPVEDHSSIPLVDYLPGDLEDVAETFVEAAVELSGEYADNASVLIADLHRGAHY